MFCVNCGKELADNAKFCTWCGTHVMNGESKKAPEAAVVMPAQEKKDNGKIWGIGAAIVVVLLGIVFMGKEIVKFHQGQEKHEEKTVAGAKAVREDDTKDAAGVDDARTDDKKKSSSEDTEVQESEEASGIKTEKPIVREAGLYQSDGSFIPWDDLGIDVETDYFWKSYYEEDTNPCKVFRDNNYEGELVLPDTLTNIGDNVFSMDGLTGIDLSNTQITSINKNAFYCCNSLTSIVWPDNLTSIGMTAFYCCAFTSIDLPDTITNLGNGAFTYCVDLVSIDLSNTQITRIAENTFFECRALTNIYLPDTLTSIDNMAFYSCESLKNINYVGTMEEWSAIRKMGEWNKDTSIETITCSDGVIDF